MSPKDELIHIRLTSEERKKIEEAAKEAGFISIAEYVRYMTIGEGRAIDRKFDEIIKRLEKDQKIGHSLA